LCPTSRGLPVLRRNHLVVVPRAVRTRRVEGGGRRGAARDGLGPAVRAAGQNAGGGGRAAGRADGEGGRPGRGRNLVPWPGAGKVPVDVRPSGGGAGGKVHRGPRRAGVEGQAIGEERCHFTTTSGRRC